MDMEAFRKGFRDQAEKQVKVRLALEKIAKLEEIAPTAEEIEAEYAKYAEQYQICLLYTSPGGIESVRQPTGGAELPAVGTTPGALFIPGRGAYGGLRV